MTEATKKMLKANTPRGIAKWPKLTDPDYGTKEYPKPEGEYSVKLVFDEASPAFAAFEKKMAAHMETAERNAAAAFAKLPKATRDKIGAPKGNPLFTPIYDADENPTGQVEIKLTMKAGGVVKKGPREGKKWSRKPDLYDALGRKITSKVEIWGGSELICSFSFDPEGYFIPGTGNYGVKLQLEAVQIVTLRKGGEKSASDHGFGAVEDGFSISDYADEQAMNEEMEDEFSGSGAGTHLPGDASEEPEGAADF